MDVVVVVVDCEGSMEELEIIYDIDLTRTWASVWVTQKDRSNTA